MNLKTDLATIVFAAAKTIERRRERANIRTVITEIGHGSPHQIGLLLKIWREQSPGHRAVRITQAAANKADSR